jgi:hypothetical protein
MTVDDRAQIVDLQRIFVTPPELLGSRPRDITLSAGGRALYVLAIALLGAALIAGVAFYLQASQQAQRWRIFDRDSVAGEATVTRLWRGSGDPKPYLVAYSFEASGRTYGGQSRVPSSVWRTLETGSSTAVRYLPDDPAQNAIVGTQRRQLPIWVAFVLAAVLGACGALCFVVLNSQRRLLMDGRAAPALVTAIVRHHTTHGGTYRSIKYRFPLLSGGVASGKSESSRKPPPVGTVMCIVYDPDRPTRSRPYPFPLVRVGDGSHFHSFSTQKGQVSTGR